MKEESYIMSLIQIIVIVSYEFFYHSPFLFFWYKKNELHIKWNNDNTDE